MQRCGIAVLGGGRMGQIRARAIQQNPRAKFLGIIDPLTSSLQLKDVINDCSGVWISTPTPVHKANIDAVLQYGKHIAIEKPVAGNVSDIKYCFEQAAQKGAHLFCSFQRRFDKSYQKLKERIDNGEIGTLRSSHIVFRDHPVPKIEFLLTGGDIFHDLLIHDGDYIMSIANERPSRVYAIGTSFNQRLKEGGIIEEAHCILEFPSGFITSIELNRHSAYGYDQRVEVHGSDGVVNLDNVKRDEVRVMTKTSGYSESLPVYSFPERFGEAFESEVDYFIDIIMGNKKPVVSSEDCVNATAVAEACRVSFLSGKSVMVDDVL